MRRGGRGGGRGNSKAANHPPRAATRLFPGTFYTRLPTPLPLGDAERDVVRHRLSVRAKEQASPWFAAGSDSASCIQTQPEFDVNHVPVYLRPSARRAARQQNRRKRTRSGDAVGGGERDASALDRELDDANPSIGVDEDDDGDGDDALTGDPATKGASASASAPAADDLYDHEDNSDGSDPDDLDYAAVHNDDDELYGEEDHLGGAVGDD